MEKKVLKAVLIEDDPVYARLVQTMLQDHRDVRIQLETFDHLSTGLERLQRGDVDILLLDLSLPDSEHLETVRRVRSCSSLVPVIVLSALDDEATEVEVIHEGAQDYLVKEKVDGNLLFRAIFYAIERKWAETALRQAEEKYRGIFEHIIEGVFQTTPDGRYLSANAALARIYGYDSPQELMAHVTDIARRLYVDEGRRDEFVRLMQQHDTVTDFQSRVYRKDGTIIWIAENVRAIRDPRGRLICYEGTVEDITEHKRAEEQLRNSEALYHSLVENLPQNIFRKDLEERFTFANQRFCLTLGLPLEKILGKTDFDFFPAELAAKYQADDRRILESGVPFEAVEEHQPPGGGKLYVQVVKTPILDAEGRTLGLQGIFWDITTRKQAEERERLAREEVARSREELRAKNEQMEDDLRMARELQQAMLPQQHPTFPRGTDPKNSALRILHRYLPTGEVGGDFFNVIALSETRAGVFICDVMGHGVRSALVTSMLRAMIEELGPSAEDPGVLLTQINRDIRGILRQAGTPTFATAFYMILDLANGTLRYANAGHPKPLLLQRSSGQVRALQNASAKSQAALGLFENSVYPSTEGTALAGDVLLLFTDGLLEVEAPDGALFSQDHLACTLSRQSGNPLNQLIDGVLEQVKEFAQGAPFADDVCILGMEVVRYLPGT